MKTNKTGVRGNNIVSKTLNKNINGKLAKKQSSFMVITIFSILFVIILVACINMLGFKTGTLTAIGFSILVAISGVLSNHHVNEAEKTIKKHPWKAFSDKNE